jgi:uncharacterized protein YbjT (DUF2867 family)/AcrR family transcriptional regulator
MLGVVNPPRRVPGPEERGVRAERAREKIVQAAVAEFSAKGYTGARTADIAARAGVNSQLISYYFDGKQGLLDEVRRRGMQAEVAAPDASFAEALRARVDVTLDRPDWARLAAWQSLGDCPFASQEDQERFTREQRSAMARAAERMRHRQLAGEVTGKVSPEFALLVMYALILAPVTMPQFVRDVLGDEPLSAQVRQRLASELARLLGGVEKRSRPASEQQGGSGMVTVVFGARGNVGRHVAAGLRSVGEAVRVTSRNPGAAGFGPQVQVATADLAQPESLPAALAGAEKAFVYAIPRGIEGFVAAAKSAGVRHVVLLSSGAVVNADADDNPIARQHRAVELAIERSGLDWTFIRPGMFATNTRWWWTESIRTGSLVRLPYPDAQTAPVHEEDIAALAVAALTEPGHEYQAYTVYGPRSLTLREQARQIGDAIGREIRVEVTTPEQARADLGKTMPPIGVEAIMRGWEAGIGEPARISVIVEKITGRPARTFAEWAVDHADDFR